MVTTVAVKPRVHTVELSVPPIPEFIQIVRLVLSGIGNVINLNVDEIEDLKLAVGEACYNLFQTEGTGEQISIKASADSRKLVIDVSQKTERLSLPRLFATGTSTERGIGVVLMKHLMDRVEYKTSANGSQIRLVKFRSQP